MSGTFLGIDHVQIAVPVGEAGRCREFYVDLLGLEPIERPLTSMRSFLWVRAGRQEIHFREDPDFRATSFAHPGFLVSDSAVLAACLSDAGYEVRIGDAVGPNRFHTRDPFGNRLEFIGSPSLDRLETEEL